MGPELGSSRVAAERRIVSVILAAGPSERMGRPKAALLWPSGSPGGRRPLAIHQAEERLSAESRSALVVVRTELIPALLAYLRPGIDLLASHGPVAQGPAVSLAVAVPRLPEAEFVVLVPVDIPPPRPETLARLLDELAGHPDALAARPTCRGRPGHPVVVRPGALAPYTRPKPPSLRDFIKSLGAQLLEVEVGDPNVIVDISTPADVVGLLGEGPKFLPGPWDRFARPL